VGKADIAYAITHHFVVRDVDADRWPPMRLLYVGPDRAGRLLEVIVIVRDDGVELAIHAMEMRPKYQTLLQGLEEDG
jgi:hypothetical protein